MPTAVPTMPDSASGLSMTRSSPKSFCRPSVIRKTPPSLPTSSPMIRTLGSSSIALRRPMLRPLASVILVISGSPRNCGAPAEQFRGVASGTAPLERVEVLGEAVALGGELVGHLGVDVVEHAQRLGIGQRLASLPQVGAELLGLLLDPADEVVVDEAVPAQVDLEPGDRVLQLPVLDVVGEP